MQEDLKFKWENPGAVQYGNFINYYRFNPPEERIKLLPTDIWQQADYRDHFVALDIGCNAGDLSLCLYKFLQDQLRETKTSLLGIDIDPILIERAEEKTNNDITFKCLDFMKFKERTTFLTEYLKQRDKNKFDAVFCFSTTMWIHLNNGDESLERFLKDLTTISSLLIIEPQPWKCYKSALKRVKGDKSVFPLYPKLKIRNDVENQIENIIINSGNMTKIKETAMTKWGRKLIIFKNMYK